MEINKIWNEDCLSGMQKIPDKSVDCIICDLPYGKLTHLGWDNPIDFTQLWTQYDRICKDNAAVLLFGVEPFTSAIVMSNVKNYRQKLTWLKNMPSNILNAKKQFMNWTEDIVVFYRHLPTFNPQFWDNGKNRTRVINTNINKNAQVMRKNGKREGYTYYCGGEKSYPLTVLKFGQQPANIRKYHHPTQKPVDLIRYLIRTYTNPGDLVLDNCMGSGTTAIAALREGRNFIGFELDDFYYDMCLKRIEEEKDYVEEKKKEPKSQPLF